MTRIINYICLGLGIIMGLSYNMLFSSSHSSTEAYTGTLQSPADLKNSSVITEVHFQNKVDSLMQTNTKLVNKVGNTRSELQKAKENNKVLLEMVDTLIARSGTIHDTAAMLANCDSLGSTVQELIATANARDSLYEDLAVSLEAQVNNKDSVIGTQKEQYNSLKLSFDKSLAQQDFVLGQNLMLNKQLKTHKVKNKLLSAGVFILSGIVAYQLLHH